MEFIIGVVCVICVFICCLWLWTIFLSIPFCRLIQNRFRRYSLKKRLRCFEVTGEQFAKSVLTKGMPLKADYRFHVFDCEAMRILIETMCKTLAFDMNDPETITEIEKAVSRGYQRVYDGQVLNGAKKKGNKRETT